MFCAYVSAVFCAHQSLSQPILPAPCCQLKHTVSELADWLGSHRLGALIRREEQRRTKSKEGIEALPVPAASAVVPVPAADANASSDISSAAPGGAAQPIRPGAPASAAAVTTTSQQAPTPMDES